MNLYVFKKKSGIHGWGIFAKKNIPALTRIIEYVGEKITKAEAERRGPKLVEFAKAHQQTGAVYIFVLNKKYDIDGHVDYNMAKYINHSCLPNSEAQVIRGHIWIVALRPIDKGEEIFFNYGYDLEAYSDHPCLCKNACCPGYIVAQEYWPKLRRMLQRKSSSIHH